MTKYSRPSSDSRFPIFFFKFSGLRTVHVGPVTHQHDLVLLYISRCVNFTARASRCWTTLLWEGLVLISTPEGHLMKALPNALDLLNWRRQLRNDLYVVNHKQIQEGTRICRNTALRYGIFFRRCENNKYRQFVSM